MKSISTKNPTKATSHISDRKNSSDQSSRKDLQAIKSLPIIDVKNTNKYAEEQLILSYKKYWLKRKSIFNRYFISSFQQMQLGNNHPIQNIKLTNELASSISRDIPKSAPKKKFKIRKDEENLNDVSNFRSYVTKEGARCNETHCVRKACAA